MSISALYQRGKSFLSFERANSSPRPPSNFAKAPIHTLFPKVDPSLDGPDCLGDCSTCTIHYPAKWSIDEDEQLYGHVKGWATHMLVATGKTDWKRDVEDEKGSVMEAVRDCGVLPNNGRLMLSASNMPLPENDGHEPASSLPTTVLLLPSFTFIDNVAPSSVPELIKFHINNAPTTTTPLVSPEAAESLTVVPTIAADLPLAADATLTELPTSALPSSFSTRPCHHKYLILLCSQSTRDARCGQSAPLLRREFERHLRPLGLYRDLQDDRPGGVGIYFISHVGGHKFAANIMVYRRADNATEEGEAVQCIWIARVKPEDCEGIIKYTVLKGKVIKPERQLRGGWDRRREVASW